jgi:hypothetical protein
MANPQTLGSMVDQFYKARANRLAAEKKIEVLKKGEAEMKEAILRKLTADKLEGAKGKLATVAITSTEIPMVADWSAFYEFIKTTGQIDLLEKRPSKGACVERWEAGEEIPGVSRNTRVDLSFTKHS